MMRAMLLTALCVLTAAAPVSADVLTGPIDGLPESRVTFFWGDGASDLFTQWSSQVHESTGYIYGSSYLWSNVDLYIYQGLTDPTTISDATAFPYTSDRSGIASAGDTVFFRGVNGYYGAWRIDEIYPSNLGQSPYSYLDGQWYFQTDGSGSFVPEPGSLSLLLIGLVALRRGRRARS